VIDPLTGVIADRLSPENRRKLSGPAMRTFLAIADLLDLGEVDRLRVLGNPSRSTFQKWAKDAREHRDITLSADTLTRISAVLGIYQALRILITSGEMDALLLVRRYLDSERGSEADSCTEATPLEQLQKWWLKASEDERSEFLQRISPECGGS
jgi:hypothetical protein